MAERPVKVDGTYYVPVENGSDWLPFVAVEDLEEVKR